jgi:hypothetical protein
VSAERFVKAQYDGGFTARFEGVVFSAFDGLQEDVRGALDVEGRVVGIEGARGDTGGESTDYKEDECEQQNSRRRRAYCRAEN